MIVHLVKSWQILQETFVAWWLPAMTCSSIWSVWTKNNLLCAIFASHFSLFPSFWNFVGWINDSPPFSIHFALHPTPMWESDLHIYLNSLPPKKQESSASWKAQWDRAFTGVFSRKFFPFLFDASLSEVYLSSSVGLKKLNNSYLVNLHVFLQDFLGWQITWIPFPDSPKRVTGWGETL